MYASPWTSLEELPTLVALLPIWREMLGDNFLAFSALCLSVSTRVGEHYPCPLARYCAFRILRHPDHTITGHCKRIPARCPPVQFTETDVTALELNWQKLGRALCHALNLDYKFRDMGLFHTAQIGSWSTDAVPVFLTVQCESRTQRLVTAELVATLNQKFILLTPTSRMTDARSLQILARVGAAVFPLNTTVTLAPNGTLLANTIPGKLFAAFTPQPKEFNDNAARQLFILAKTLDADYGRKAPPSVVLRMYCVDELEPGQIAQRLECGRSLIYSRLKLLCAKLGMDLSALRRMSSQVEAAEASLSDTRARRIHRPSALDQPGDDEDT
jgi:hypothetical protein